MLETNEKQEQLTRVNCMAKKKKIWKPADDDDEDKEDSFNDDEDENGASPFGGNPEDFLSNFQDIFKNLMKQFKSKDFMDIFKQLGLPNPEGMSPDGDEEKGKPGIKGPLVFGFSLKFDKNGKPIINRFGNTKPIFSVDEPEQGADGEVEKEPMPSVVREPVADVIYENDEVVVVIELPGVEKDDIKLKATEYSLEISAFSKGVHKYHKRVDLDVKINPDHAKARYTNGILEVRLKKIGEKERKASEIPVE